MLINQRPQEHDYVFVIKAELLEYTEISDFDSDITLIIAYRLRIYL